MTLRLRFSSLVLLGAAISVIGCATQPDPVESSPNAPSSLLASPSLAATPAVASGPTPAPSPTLSTSFAFTADAVIDFYETAGFVCQDPQASPGASGWTVTTCGHSDVDGRRLVVGVVRSPQGALGDGFASVTGMSSEDVLSPEAALDHLSGFLGAMLGEVRATPLLPWLAGSMGNVYEETTDRDLRVATYLEPTDDTGTIWLEVAGPDYLAAPTP
jgi:hypothetical protein